MSYYSDIYNKRLNRFGDDFKDRIQGQRIKDFEELKRESTFSLTFQKGNASYTGVLQPRKQDETKSQFWLLTSITDTFSGGDIITSGSKKWMILYQDSNETRGYNKYCVIKMTHTVSWKKGSSTYSSPAYFYGPLSGFISDTSRVQSRSTGPNAPDPSKRTHLIMPKTLNLQRQDYLLIDGEGYYVSGYDYNSTPGVEYFSLTQTFTRTEQTPVTPSLNDDMEDYFFFTGGI